MKSLICSLALLLCTTFPAVCSASVPALTVPATGSVGINMATLALQSSETGTGYFTLLYGSNSACGTGAQVAAGLDSTGTAAPYHGSLPLFANVTGPYTVRNLMQNTAYTICFTADSLSDVDLNPAPVAVNLTTAAFTALANPAWGLVGSAGFSSGTASFTTVAFAPDGTPFVAFMDNGNSYKATVMKFSAGAWVVAGNPGFSSGEADNISLAFSPDGIPSVAYTDNANNNKVTVMRLNGGTWSEVGSAGFSSGPAYYTSLAFAPDGVPYVAYKDGSNGGKSTVMQFTSGSWTVVGSVGFSAGIANSISLVFAPDGTPCVAYSEGSSYRATVMKFSGGVWSSVGSTGLSAGVAHYTTLAFAPDGTPYVAFSDLSKYSKATVMKYSGTAWSVVGNTGFSAGTANYISLAISPDGAPFVAYDDYLNGDRATVMQYDGGNWVAVGQAGFSPGAATYTSLAFAPDGIPFLAFQNGASNGNASLMKLKNGSTTTVSADQNPAALGQPVSFTAMVSPSSATGTVTFMDGAAPLGTASLSGGSATLITSTLGAGSHNITAVYAGDGTYFSSTSSPLSQVVDKDDTVTVVVSNPNPSLAGQAITFTATVTPAAASGTVTFMDSAASLGTASLAGGTASYTTAAMTEGSHSITAVYAGNGNYTGSTSAVTTHTVNAAGTTAAVVSSLNPSLAGQEVTFTATVTPAIATGTITFMDGATVLGVADLSDGTASYSTSALGAGSHLITVIYNGFSSQMLMQTVNMVLATPAAENVGSNIATLVLQSSGTGTGYFTLLYGSGAVCGTGTQVAAGQDNSGSAAPYHGSLPLTAATTGRFTVRNLTQSTDYTICFTADSPGGFNLYPAPVSADLVSAASPLFNNPGWGVVGNSGFSGGEARYTSLSFSPDGSPYVVYVDESNNNQVTVMKYASGAWSVVGSAGFSVGDTESVSLAFAPDGTPYVVYMDEGNSFKATVKKYSGGSWIVVGSAGFSAGEADSISLAFSPDGEPYVAYTDYANSGKATVMKFNGAVWTVVGSAGFSAGLADYTSLAFAPDGAPHVAFVDYGNSRKVTVMKFIGGIWSVAGSAGFSAGEADSVSLAFSPDGTPSVAYSDYGHSFKATVMRYNGGAWNDVGTAGFSSGAADTTSLAFAADGTPYVAYVDNANSDKATVMHYSGGVWSETGDAGFSYGAADSTSLAFTSYGIPCVVYQDLGNKGRATVMQLFTSPVITSVSPSNGPAFGRTAVTITGSGFLGATAVHFGNSNATDYTINSDSEIMVTSSPASPAGTVDIIITTPIRSSSASSADQFTFDNSAPSAPSNVVATASNGQATISFSAPASDGGSSITAYTVTVSPGNTIVTGVESPIIVTGLSNNIAYSFSIAATNSIGTSPSVTAVNQYALSIAIIGAGSGSVNSNPSGITCTGGTCASYYSSGSAFSLLPSASPGSRFSGWNSPCTLNGTSCYLGFNSLFQSITAAFDILPYVQVDGNPPKLFGLLQLACNSAITDAVIKAQGMIFIEDLALDTPATLTLMGGFDAAFLIQNGYTVLHGGLTIGQASLVVDQLIIE